jgi:hypothetical protein
MFADPELMGRCGSLLADRTCAVSKYVSVLWDGLICEEVRVWLHRDGGDDVLVAPRDYSQHS